MDNFSKNHNVHVGKIDNEGIIINQEYIPKISLDWRMKLIVKEKSKCCHF